MASGNRTDISLDDPNFWDKWAKKADIDMDMVNGRVCTAPQITHCKEQSIIDPLLSHTPLSYFCLVGKMWSHHCLKLKFLCKQASANRITQKGLQCTVEAKPITE